MSFKPFSGHRCVDQILCTSILQDHQTYFPHSLLTCSNMIWWVDIFWPPDMNQAVLIPSSQQDRRRQCTKKLIGQDKGRKINQEVPTWAKKKPSSNRGRLVYFIANWKQNRIEIRECEKFKQNLILLYANTPSSHSQLHF